ncbi:MAG: alkaline phosphatase family protein [Alphaproteobacteria bacterium]|nr:alkaline phosphatase family protein [Alphaproteobacteria bacterium]
MRHRWIAVVVGWTTACASRTPVAPAAPPPPPRAAPSTFPTQAEAPWPVADAPLSRVAFGSCNHQDHDQAFWATIAATDPQLFVYAGDNVYADVVELPEGGVRLVPFDADRLRTAYTHLAARPEFAAFRASVPILPVWDDHDYGENDAGGSLDGRDVAQALFLDFWQVPADDARRSRPGVYTAATFGPPGQRLQVVLLDTRAFRSDLHASEHPGTPGHEAYDADADPSKTMLGTAQWAWLARTLAEPADLRVVVSSIQVLTLAHGYEKWGNLPAERQRLLDALHDAGDVLLVSGDAHVAGVYQLDDGLGPRGPLVEVTTSSLNRSFGPRVQPDPLREGELVAAENFATLTVDWAARSAAVDVRATSDGHVLHARTVAFAPAAGR